MIGAGVVVLVLGLDGRIGPTDATLLCGLLLAYTVFLVVQSRRQAATAPAEFAAELAVPAAGRWDSHRAVQVALVLAGLVLLVAGSEALVTAAVSFARVLGVSELVIGLTIVAVGTSLPEVAASVMAALKGERDIAVGNVVGSCVFNLLGVVGVAGLAVGSTGLPIPPSVQHFDLWVMLAALLACLPIFLTGREVARWEGALFLLYYAAYTAYLVLRAQAHDALPAYSSVMIGFFVPLTVVTLVVAVFRRAPD